MFVDERERRVCRLHELPVAEADLNSLASLAEGTDSMKKEGRMGKGGKRMAIFLAIFDLVVSDGVSGWDGWVDDI